MLMAHESAPWAMSHFMTKKSEDTYVHLHQVIPGLKTSRDRSFVHEDRAQFPSVPRGSPEVLLAPTKKNANQENRRLNSRARVALVGMLVAI